MPTPSDRTYLMEGYAVNRKRLSLHVTAFVATTATFIGAEGAVSAVQDVIG